MTLGRSLRDAAFGVGLVAVASTLAADPATTHWNPSSRPGFWCGTGEVPAGHAMRELRSSNGRLDLTLTVRQDDDRLCYVADGIAEAPLLRVRPGDRLAITLKNEITDPSRIDTFVPLRYLRQPNAPIAVKAGYIPVEGGMRHEATGATNLHLHGFAVPPVAPADDVIKRCADPASGPVGCGTRQIDYVFDIPKTMPPGLYWYHPHVHGEVQPQLLMGLSGAIVVEGPDDDARREAGIDDRVLILRQLADADERHAYAVPVGATMGMRHAPAPAADRAATTIDTEDELACGQALPEPISLNGAPVIGGRPPDRDIAAFGIAEGGRQLWRIVNGATDFFLNLGVIDEAGKPQPLTVTAWDGVAQTDDKGRGAALHPMRAPLLVPPSGRIEFYVSPPQAGKTFFLVSRPVDTGCAGDNNPERWLARIVATPAGDKTLCLTPPDGERAASIGMFTDLAAPPPQAKRRLAFTEYPRPGSADQTDFYLTEIKPGAIIRPYEMKGPPAFTVKAGVIEEWEIENWTRELHAFHAHQVHFRVIAIDGKALTDPPLRDVVTVPYATPVDPKKPDGPLKPGRVRIRILFPPELAGDIPIHCHLVDHEDNGMMAVVHVVA